MPWPYNLGSWPARSQLWQNVALALWDVQHISHFLYNIRHVLKDELDYSTKSENWFEKMCQPPQAEFERDTRAIAPKSHLQKTMGLRLQVCLPSYHRLSLYRFNFYRFFESHQVLVCSSEGVVNTKFSLSILDLKRWSCGEKSNVQGGKIKLLL